MFPEGEKWRAVSDELR